MFEIMFADIICIFEGIPQPISLAVCFDTQYCFMNGERCNERSLNRVKTCTSIRGEPCLSRLHVKEKQGLLIGVTLSLSMSLTLKL